MTKIRLTLASIVSLGALLASCASAPQAKVAPAAASTRDCSQLSEAIANAEEARRAAEERKQQAWKVVIPIVVIARYAHAKSSIDQADKDLDQLHAEFEPQRCA
jgi:outer membrane murein-binding lipoprotein Lpp